MQDKIPVYGTGADGNPVLEGHHAVDPSGHLVLIPRNNPLPDAGWSWATQDELDAAAARAAAIRNPDQPAQEAPAEQASAPAGAGELEHT